MKLNRLFRITPATVLFICAAGGIILLLLNNNLLPWNPLSKTSSKTHGIILTENGFTPSKIAISKGDRIVFKTKRNTQFWPASNLHPTHEIYLEFDPQRPIEPHESWSFIFRQRGRWNYHDHLFPHYRGEILVQ